MKPIHKARRPSLFMMAVAGLMFLAVCAYLGAALYGRLQRPFRTLSLKCVSISDSTPLRGIALRREQPVCSPEAELLYSGGEKLPAGAVLALDSEERTLKLRRSALFYPDCDGFEYLSPERLPELSVSMLENLLREDEKPPEDTLGRLIFDFEWYYAALADKGARLPESGRCRIKFKVMEESTEAEVVSIRREKDKNLIILRLTQGGDSYMRLRKCEAELIFSQYTGLELPAEAVHRDAEGNEFVYTLAAGAPESTAVDIIYESGDRCIAALSQGAGALREGALLIVSGENVLEEGKKSHGY